MENPIIENVLYAGWEAELNKLGKVLTDLATKAEKINIGLSSKGGGTDNSGYEKLKTTVKELTEAKKLSLQIEKQLEAQKAKELSLAAQIATATTDEAKSIAALNMSKKEANAVTKLTVQLASNEVGSLKAVEAQIGLNVIKLSKYSEEQIKASTVLKRLQADTENLRNTQKTLNQATGNYKDSVGNYRSALSGTTKTMNSAYNSTFQMTQVMRELPNFAIDARIGFMSLSNNLPMLYDGFKQLATQIDAVTGKQKGWGYAWKTMGASILGMNTIMIVGVTLLTLYGKQIIDFIGVLFKGEKAGGSFKAQLEALNKTLKDGTAKTDIAKYLELGVILDKAKEGTYDAEVATKKYNETMGDAYGKVKDVNGALRGYNEYGQDYITSTIAMAAATDMLSESADLFAKRYKTKKEMEGIANKDELSTSYYELYKEMAKEEGGLEKLYKMIGTANEARSMAMSGEISNDVYNKYLKFASIDNAGKYRELLKSLSDTENKLKEQRKTIDGLMNSVSLQFTKGVKVKDTVVQNAKDINVKLKFYDEARLATIKSMAEVEQKIGQESVDGTRNTFEEREKAAQAFYYMSKTLLKSDQQEKEFNAKQDYEKIKSDGEKAKAENLKKLKAKKLTDQEYKDANTELNKDLKNALDNYEKAKLDAVDSYSKDEIKARETLMKNLISISDDQYKEELEKLDISNEEKKRLIEQNLSKTKLSIEKSGLVGAFAKAFGFEKDDDWKMMQAEQDAEMQTMQADRDTLELKSLMAKGQERENILRDLAALENKISDESTSHKIENDAYWAKKEKELYEDLGSVFNELINESISSYFEITKQGLESEAKKYEETKEDELDVLESQHKAGLMSDETYEQEKSAKEAYYKSISDDLKKQEFELDKRQKEAQIGIDLAASIMNIWSKHGWNPVGAGLLTAAVVGIAGLQVAAIEAAEYADGGKLPILGNGLITNSPNVATRPNGDNMLAYVTAGSKAETILNTDQVLALGGAYAMKQAGVPGYEDARYQPDMSDIRTGYSGKNGKIIVNANFESEKIVKELRDIKKSLSKSDSNPLMNSLKSRRYANR